MVGVNKKDNSIPVTINIFEIFEDDVKKCTEHADKNRKQCVSFFFINFLWIGGRLVKKMNIALI